MAARAKTRRSPGKKKSGKKRGERKARKVSRTHKPEGMSLEAWQRELRRQFGAEQEFELENLGEHTFFSEFQVTNPDSGGSYVVVIRGDGAGENRCDCPDFTTNTLGTCKHIEFTLARLKRKRGAKKAFSEGHEPDYSEVYLHYGAAREVRFRPGADCPSALARLAAKYFDDEGRLRDDAYGQFEEFLSQAGALDHELFYFEDVLRFVAEKRDADTRQRRLDEAFRHGVDSAGLDDLLRVPLYPYQREGALFAARAGRSLIADEMGLGKTVQALAAAEIMARHFGVERTLIVCPTSLKHQWEREIERFTDRPAMVIGGPRWVRREQFEQESFFKITNYDTVYRDQEHIDGWSPDLVILDEAQRIKNWDTRTARSVKKIDSPYCVVLTGTPLENRLEELISIVQFVDQQRLGPTFRLLDEHQQRDPQTGRVIGYRDLHKLGKTLSPVLLRRRKAEVLSQLPERLEKRFFVGMTPQQLQLHTENQEMVARIAAKWRRYKFLTEKDQRRLMIGLQNMRMSCNSTYLLDKQTDFGMKADELLTLLDEVLEDREAKVVVFSQWVRTHELIRRRLAGRDWEHVFFHGGVPSQKRKALIDRFREEPNCRVFLATDSGGVGLNLQFASAVVNMDLPWNPAVLEQRIGRVHRLGQQRPVQVVNFVATGTIEEGMLGVLGFKQGLFEGVLDGGENEVFLGESRLGKFMETVEKVTDNISTNGQAEDETDSDVGAQVAEVTDRDDGVPRPASSPRAGAETAPKAATGASAARSLPEASGDPLAGLIQNGLALLGQMLGAENASRGSGSSPESPVQISRDERTGRRRLSLQLPEDDVVDRALAGLQELLVRLRG